jgi:hypothetical protein
LSTTTLNQLQFLRFEGEGHVSQDTLTLFDDALRDTATESKALGNMTAFAENRWRVDRGWMSAHRPFHADVIMNLSFGEERHLRKTALVAEIAGLLIALVVVEWLSTMLLHTRAFWPLMIYVVLYLSLRGVLFVRKTRAADKLIRPFQ